MPPKLRISKEDIVTAVVALVRKDGVQAINARNIASALNCSTQPVFSNFSTMKELRNAIVETADALYRKYMQRETESGAWNLSWIIFDVGGVLFPVVMCICNYAADKHKKD